MQTRSLVQKNTGDMGGVIEKAHSEIQIQRHIWGCDQEFNGHDAIRRMNGALRQWVSGSAIRPSGRRHIQ
ncbi:hypothetical protein VNO77_38871 [Canavalia gladiata]|uniref:Uncharacterized protein n=1 Tax=Canavalia gladiata TaxID=3824 RepID=A0AAN9KBN1_CANGL